jgi:A/G-specific adenine glycosylase
VLKPRATCDPLEDPSSFQDALAEWFRINGKDYPWRRTADPYAVLISEVMLQQTQIATVLGRGFYTRFLARFPDAATLAEAEDEPLLKAWEGLGYYRRARMLRETARAVVKAVEFPQTLEALQALPGVGRYTANAVRAFAYDLPAAVVDGNVARVLSRILDFREEVDAPAGLKKLWEWAEQLADPYRSRVYNSALMELGQTICRTGVPDCLNCPVSAFCQTREPELLPRKVAKRKTERVDTHVLWAVDSAGRILLYQEKGKRREGLWMLPARSETQIANYPKVATRTYGITRYHVTMHIYASGPVDAQQDEAWHEADSISKLAMASPYRKAVEALLVES